MCVHPQVDEINKALINGVSYYKVAERYGLSRTSVYRHAKNHLPAALVKAKEAEEVACGDDLLAQVRSLRDRTLSILNKAESTGKLAVAVQAIKAAQSNIELMARMLIEMERQRRADEERESNRQNDLAGMSNEELRERLRILREVN